MNPREKPTDCLFCKIIAGEIPSTTVFKNTEIVVFVDINPTTPVHMMVVPVKHIVSLGTMSAKDTPIVGKMTAVANKVAKEMGLAQRGYRLVINSGPEAGQVIQHLHMHLLGGRELKWEH